MIALRYCRNMSAFALLGCICAGSALDWTIFHLNHNTIHLIGAICGVIYYSFSTRLP